MSRLIKRTASAFPVVALVLSILVMTIAPLLIREYMELDNISGEARTAFYTLPYLTGIVFLAFAIWMFLSFRDRSFSGLYIVFCSSIAVAFGIYFLATKFHILELIWLFAGCLASGTIIHFSLVFPYKSRIVNRFPFAVYAGYALIPGALILWLLGSYQDFSIFGLPMTGIFALPLLFLITSMSYRQLRTASPVTRNTLRLVLWSIFAGVLPIIIWLLSPVFGISLQAASSTYFLFPIIILPFTLGLSIARYRITGSKFIFSRVFLYTTLSFLIGAAYALLVSGLGLVFVSQAGDQSLILNGILIFIFALAFNPLHTKAQSMIDSVLFRREIFLKDKLDEFNRELTRKLNLEELVKLLGKTIEQNLTPKNFHIFLFEPSSGFYKAQLDSSGNPTSELRFAEDSKLIDLLSIKGEPVFLDEKRDSPEFSPEEHNKIRVLNAELFVAIPGQSRLTGWIAAGKALNNKGYSFAELTFLQDICELCGMAIERELALNDLSRRIRELDVLTRVAREVNITLNLEDILDLIYQQTLQVIPFNDLMITLKNNFTRTITRVYVVHNNERRQELENAALARGEGLEQFVLFASEPLREQDYAHACRKYSVLTGQTKYYAWLGVPLRASEDTIGSISISSRNPSIVFTEEHENILSAIADQAAGAIVKAQLLNESQQRARQMELLNEMSTLLTSTLQIDDLNHQIMDSAVKIINCEAGSLLLVDEARGDMVFEEACGPVADEIIGKRLAHGVGLVGRAIQERQPVMVNDVVEDIDWFSDKDEETGFTTRGLLVVPLISQDEVIGALEVINKSDSLPFDKDDQVMLSAFAAQAVIAMDNAKLYTLTDQALALRVEELSVMQRIDRELNTSLDLVRAMTITLEWAMRQTYADAGLIGMVEEVGIQVMAAQGYENTYPDWEHQPLRKNLYGVEQALFTVKIQTSSRNELRDADMILPGTEWQTVIPIMREGEAIGLIFLEKKSSAAPVEETSDFLLRLCDHAAIAISNAQLYSAVNQANIAKSDFVSFVSHELKTPMTSIKGYADLLAAGAVGKINDAQNNFLTTIRDNVDRMSTLVSDLADISRIEAGRLELNFSAVSIQAVVDSVIESTQAMFNEKSQTLEIVLPDALPMVWADQNRLVQIITNLLTNASKYTREEGKIMVRAEEAANIWDEKGASTVLHLRVVDNGIGIIKDDWMKIFQQYFRTESGKDLAQGTGLGLNITRYLVEMQGGLIWFESEVGVGTTFHVTIPVSETSIGMGGR